VCPEKAGIFSESQTHQGNSQNPVTRIVFVEETKRRKPIRTFESMLFVYQELGREENPTASDASPATVGIRLEAVAWRMAV
jgi:hypothetical protein